MIYVVTGDQYRTIDVRMGEVKRQLCQKHGSPLDPVFVAHALQAISEGRFGVEPRFSPKLPLLSLRDQASRIREFNRKYWDNFLSEEQLWRMGDSDRVQNLEDLEVFHVSFGSPRRDVEMWWRVFVGDFPNAKLPYDFLGGRRSGNMFDRNHLRRDPSANAYRRGIHRVRVNLLANWETEQGYFGRSSPKMVRDPLNPSEWLHLSAEKCRQLAKAEGLRLAHAEVFSTYGIHSELFQMLDGASLPFPSLAGFTGNPRLDGREEWSLAPFMRWDRQSRTVELDVGHVANTWTQWAAPTIIG